MPAFPLLFKLNFLILRKQVTTKHFITMKGILIALLSALLPMLPVRAQGTVAAGGREALGDSCLEVHDTYNALKYYGEALAADSSAALLRKVARCYYMRGDYGRCVSTMKPVAGPRGDSLTLQQMRYMFDSYKNLGMEDEQVSWGRAILHRCPMDGEVTAALAAIYNSSKDYLPYVGRNLAGEYLKRDSTCIPVLRQYADAEFLLEEFDDAIAAYHRLLELGDSTYNVVYSLGMSYMQVKNDSLAYLWLKKAAEKSGMKSYACLYRLGMVCVDRDSVTEGLKYLTLAYELMQPDHRIMFVIKRALGEGYYKQGHYWNAIYAWQDALKYNRNSMATIFNTAQAYGLVGRHDKEKAFYRSFLSMAALSEPNATLDEMVKQAEAAVGGHEDFKGVIIGIPE